MPSLSALRSRVAALPGTARLVEALAVPSAEVIAAAPAGRPAPRRLRARPDPHRGARARRHRHRPRGRGPRTPPSRRAWAPAPSASSPRWETLPHERLSPRSDTVGQRLSVLRRLTHPEAGDDTHGPLVGRRRARCAPCSSRSPRAWATCAPVALQAGDERPARAGRRGARGRRLRPHRPRRAARRVRRARRHPRRLPAHRGAPAAPRVLGRHGRGDPLVQGRRPALASRSPSTACGRRPAASCCSPMPCARGPRRSPTSCPVPPTCSRSSPRASPSRAWSRSPRPSSTAWRPCSTCCPTAPLLVACDPERVRTRAHDLTRHQPGVPRRRLGQRRERQRRADRPRRRCSAPRRSAPWPSCASRPATSGCAGSTSPRSPATTSGDVLDLGLEVAPDLPRQHRRGRRRAAPAWSPTTGRCWSPPRARAWPSASPRCSPSTTPRAGWSPTTPTRSRASSRSPPARSGRASSRPARGSPSSPRPTSPARPAAPARRPRTCAGCRRGAATRSTRSSCGPATSSCTSSTASGRFVEMVQRTVAGATREYLVLEYAPSKRGHPGDRLYVPTDQLDQVTRYVGGEQPTLNKMGGSDWHQTKSRAKRYVKQIAAELIRLYSRADGDHRARVLARHPVAARARGRLRLRRDPRPAEHHRRGQGRHGALGADGPPGLRRRRLRQDRDRGARGVQGDPGRQAGRHPRARPRCSCSSTPTPSPSATPGSRSS